MSDKKNEDALCLLVVLVFWIVILLSGGPDDYVDAYNKYERLHPITKVTAIVTAHNIHSPTICSTLVMNNGTLESKCFGGDLDFRYLHEGNNHTCTIQMYSETNVQSTVVNGLNAYPVDSACDIYLVKHGKGHCYLKATIDEWNNEVNSTFNYDLLVVLLLLCSPCVLVIGLLLAVVCMGCYKGALRALGNIYQPYEAVEEEATSVDLEAPLAPADAVVVVQSTDDLQ